MRRLVCALMLADVALAIGTIVLMAIDVDDYPERETVLDDDLTHGAYPSRYGRLLVLTGGRA